MLINFVLPAIGNSGGIDVVYKYVDMLINYGHDVYVYKELKASNMHRFDSNFKNMVHQIYCTAKICAQKNQFRHLEDHFVWTVTDKTIRDADVIIATAWTTAYKVNALSVSKGKKYYFIQDYEVWDNKYWGEESYRLPLNKIVISSWINKQLNENLGLKPCPVVYNGIDLNKFKVDLKVERNKYTCLMLNHSLKKKGIKEGIEAFEKARKRVPQLKLIMFGLSDSTNLPDYIEYHQNPSHEELVKLYSSANIFIFPSLEEGWGLTPIEAMACGCVVVGTNTGFTLDIGKNRTNMMISPPGNVQLLSENIVNVIKDNCLSEYVRSNARNTVQYLEWEKSGKRFEEVLKDF